MLLRTTPSPLSKGLLFMSVQDRRSIRDFLIERDYEAIAGQVEWDGSPFVFCSMLLSVIRGYFSEDSSSINLLWKSIIDLAISYETNDKIKLSLQQIIIE
jgi:hypothetical protein